MFTRTTRPSKHIVVVLAVGIGIYTSVLENDWLAYLVI